MDPGFTGLGFTPGSKYHYSRYLGPQSILLWAQSTYVGATLRPQYIPYHYLDPFFLGGRA